MPSTIRSGSSRSRFNPDAGRCFGRMPAHVYFVTLGLRKEASKLKEKILEIAEIAKACPENLQAICFELLLKDYLSSRAPERRGPGPLPAPNSSTQEPQQSGTEEQPPVAGHAGGQDDLAEVDIHVKARHFLKKYSVTIEQINNLFYKDGDKLGTLYDDLKTTRVAESQVRVALLQALLRALQSGEFECDVEEVRSECEARKCYDRNNFGNNFTNNAGLFDFGKYNKSITKIRLSEAGKKELSELIAELQ